MVVNRGEFLIFFAGVELELFGPLFFVDAPVLTKGVHTGVNATAVKVSPVATIAAGVNVVGGGEAVVCRVIAAAFAAVPVQAVAETVACAVAVGARVVELAQVVLLLSENLTA